MSTRRVLPKSQKSGSIPTISSSSNLAGRSKVSTAKAPRRPTPPQDRQPQRSGAVSLCATPVSTDLQSSIKSQQTTSSEGESNIQVVIRCRRRSEREVQDNSPIIVSSDGARSKHVTIETAAPTSLLGIVQLPPTRTYSFDTVFGPEADQAMVYQDVVHSMLEEVLMGYNCTLFAYGQTGTGKTYTMQGDVSLTPLGNPSSHAGMIPRVLFRLFHHLESSGTDYSVKLSYVELYNEELRDLLAPELSAPLGSMQPMGMGGPRDNQGGLKIYEDANKKGVLIQGLEEVGVKDFHDALKLLEKGTQRRQTAATKFNDHSSRSHSVFSITIHTKETSNLGDDLLKVGKLNLVDLAGSENIGRSGAENKRAREAGMINQSLLTLGRVINALVDRSPHVPYRESKLTRLLQDSLGGRTKTCIIATVSPARCNMEETLSTLDYAMHAKSIRNKPEINQRMTRNALLKEYIAEIERLKSDVLATREKNGIFFSQEHYDQMESEKELRQTELEEAKKQVEVIEKQMRAVREEFEQSIGLLMRTDSELKETKATLQLREEDLQRTGVELEETKASLDEEVIVRKAHATQEEVLHVIAKDLRRVVQESTNDVAGLFAKLERKSKEFDDCSKTVSGHCGSLGTEAGALVSSIKDLSKSSMEQLTNMRSHMLTFSESQAALISAQSSRIDIQLSKLQASLQAVVTHETESTECVTRIQDVLQSLQKKLANDYVDWINQTSKAMDAILLEAEKSSSVQNATVENTVTLLGTIFSRLVESTRSSISAESQAGEHQREAVNSAMQTEIARLQDQNTRLCALLETERRNSKRAREDLVKKVSSLLVDFSEERDRTLREAALGVKEENDLAIERISEQATEHSNMMDESVTRGQAFSETVNAITDEHSDTFGKALSGLRDYKSLIEDNMKKAHTTTTVSFKCHSDDLTKQARIVGSCTKMFDREHSAKRARLEEVNSMVSDTRDAMQAVQKSLASTSSSIEENAEHVVATGDSLRKHVTSFASKATTRIESIQGHSAAILERGTYQEIPTGATPKKRKWRYVEKWERTQSRDVLLQGYRASRRASVTSDTSTTGPTLIPAPMVVPLARQDTIEFPVQSDTDVDGEMISTPTTLNSEMQSSSTTSSEEPFSAQMQKLAAKIPKMKTLRERSTNIMLPRATATRKR